jgi:dienelactone hydrolase
MSKMHSDTVEYAHGGITFRGCLMHDPARTSKLPGVLVVHEAWGLGDHAKSRAEKLSELGYVALAVDMFGEAKQAATSEEGMGWTKALRADVPLLRARIQAAYDALLECPQVDRDRIASIGYCFGGSTSIELARSGAKVAGVVSFHGSLATTHPAQPGAVTAKILVCTGADDPFVPPPQVHAFIDEMRHARAEYEINIYGGAKHSFTNPHAADRGVAGLEYNRQADERSWAAMHAFFQEIFRGPNPR